MEQAKQLIEQKRPSSVIRASVSFRENGQPEGKSLQEFWESAQKGAKLVIGGKVVAVKGEKIAKK